MNKITHIIIFIGLLILIVSLYKIIEPFEDYTGSNIIPVIDFDKQNFKSINKLFKKVANEPYSINTINKILKEIDMSKIEYVFLDGGHDYDTVKNDLNNCIEVIENRGTVLCDDYNLSYAPGVKQAIDEFIEKNRFNYEILCNNRFAKIEIK